MRIGIHTSTHGALERAALKAAELGANTFQIFSSSPRMWRAGTPDPRQVRELGILRERHDLYPLVIHDSYLINLAACDPVIRRKSIDAFRSELERALAIGAEYLVAHPGSCKDQSREAGVMNLAEGFAAAAHGIQSKAFTLLWENTAGAGNALGADLSELAAIGKLTAERAGFAVGYCLDTCHLYAAGCDITSEKGLRETLRKADRELGLEHVRVIHTNDSKGRLGSHLDRHANIGEGYLGEETFRRVLNHPKLRQKAFILETPVDKDGDDRRNVEALKRLCRKSRTTTKR
ncbi:MAG: deoxyribonuclease IV [Bryobacteraceae bacterium]|nr:deoxyribonuclease IV [Bryobacteraceae bacterium]